ncbi:MAG: DUF3786 domain-containing protein [Candidatus Bathyarchaeia archaeon]
MERRLEVPQEYRGKLDSLVMGAARDPSIIKSAFGGEPLKEGIGFETSVLGIKYRVLTANNNIEAFFIDPLGREVDASKLIIYMLNAFERILAGKVVYYRGRLVGITHLKGGASAQLYEKRMTNYLAVEMDGSEAHEVEKAVNALGGRMMSHPTATWSFEINPLNGARIAVAFWQGEEGIPSGASILFGEEAMDAGIPIEEIIVITEMTIDRFVAFYRRESGRKPKLFSSLYL